MDPAPNPYASPAVQQPSPVVPGEIRPIDSYFPATSGLRFANFIVDQIVTRVLSGVGGFVLGFVLALGGGFDPHSNAIIFGSFALSLAILLAYYTLMEAFFGRTLGKFITGTMVLDESGRRPGFGLAFKRSLCRLIPFEPFSFLGSQARGWHDTITRSWVVKANGVRESVATVAPVIPGQAPVYRQPLAPTAPPKPPGVEY